MNNQKTLVYTLILLLAFSGTLNLFMPAKAETWTDITLPYTITQAGSYRISSGFNGSGTALSINASNVVVDGQNCLLALNQSEGNTAIAIAPNSRNVLLKNINETGADYGVYAREGNFTITDSLFTNNNSTAIFAFNVSSFVIQNSKTNNNTYGIVTVDCSNFTVNNCHIENNTKGLATVLGHGITVQSSYFNNNTEAVSAENCTNLVLLHSAFVENQAAINASSTILRVSNITASENNDYGIHLNYSNLTALDSLFNNNTIGVYSLNSNFSITYSSLSNNSVCGVISGYSNATLYDCTLRNNQMYGELSISDNATTINRVGLRNNDYGLAILDCQKLSLHDSLIVNNSFVGLLEENCNQTMISYNNFTENGLKEENQEYGGGAILQIDTNSTVTDNILKNNYDALMIGGFNEEVASTQTYDYNAFQNNTYTFDFSLGLSSNDTTHKAYFYNNHVNDTGYVNPISFTNGQLAPTANFFHLNTTLQTGKRAILDGGRMIGGNYWGHPNGTGPSQTGTDANHDGFLDTPFDLFGNQTILDYLPYSSSFQEKVTQLTISPSAATIKAGQPINYTATAYDQYGNAWNVTADYTVNGTPFSGNLSIAEPDLYLVEASYSGQTADASLNVIPGDVDHYVVLTPTSVIANSPFTIRIVAVDAYTNIATGYSGTVTLSASNGTITPSTSGAFSYGIWTGNVAVTNAASFNITASDSSSHLGKSSAVTVNQQTIEPTTTTTPTPTAAPTTQTTQPTATTNGTTASDSNMWTWYAAAAVAFVVLAGAGVYFIKRSSKKPSTQ